MVRSAQCSLCNELTIVFCMVCRGPTTREEHQVGKKVMQCRLAFIQTISASTRNRPITMPATEHNATSPTPTPKGFAACARIELRTLMFATCGWLPFFVVCGAAAATDVDAAPTCARLGMLPSTPAVLFRLDGLPAVCLSADIKLAAWEICGNPETTSAFVVCAGAAACTGAGAALADLTAVCTGCRCSKEAPRSNARGAVASHWVKLPACSGARQKGAVLWADASVDAKAIRHTSSRGKACAGTAGILGKIATTLSHVCAAGGGAGTASARSSAHYLDM